MAIHNIVRVRPSPASSSTARDIIITAKLHYSMYTQSWDEKEELKSPKAETGIKNQKARNCHGMSSMHHKQ